MIERFTNEWGPMKLRALACVSGLLGGVCWVVRMLIGGDRADDVLFWIGLVLLFAALVGFGIGLVAKGAVWLQAIVGLAFPLLVWSVVEVLHGAGDPVMVDALAGIVIGGLSLSSLIRSRGEAQPPRRTIGAHAR